MCIIGISTVVPGPQCLRPMTEAKPALDLSTNVDSVCRKCPPQTPFSPALDVHGLKTSPVWRREITNPLFVQLYAKPNSTQ